MKKFVFRRLLQLIPLLIGISLISFFVMHLAPGDPTSLFIDPNVRPEELARVRANWGLGPAGLYPVFCLAEKRRPARFRPQLYNGQPVINEIAERLPLDANADGPVIYPDLFDLYPTLA